MAAQTPGAEASGLAITDLYDENRRAFIVRYPAWLIVALGLSGVIAFMLAGFLGFRDLEAARQGSSYFEPDWSRTFFHQPWLLYLWFCALIMTLEASILRHPALRSQLTAMLVVTVICIGLVGVIYFYNDEINKLLQNLLNAIFGQRFLLRVLGESPWTYTLLNFVLLGIFWIDTLRRWARRAQGKSPTSDVEIDLMSGTVKRVEATDEMPSMQELISGDLIAGAVLALLLALIFRPEVLNALSNVGVGIHINTCTVSWPVGTCVHGGALTDPPTIFFMDLIQALVYLPLGLLILALSATLSGFGAVGGVDESLTNPVPAAGADESSTESVSEQVTMTLINTLRSMLNRRVRVAADNLAMSLRNVVWPALVLLGTISVATTAHYIQRYLHLLSDSRTCTSSANCLDYLGNAASPSVRDLLSGGAQYQAEGLALLWGLIGVFSIVISVTLLVFKQRVAENTLRFLGLIGFIVLLTFWIFSLALSGFNAFFSLTHISNRVPFPQPGATTILSAAALAVFGFALLFRRVRGPRAGAPARVSASVGTGRS
jgi:hypothetical protein